MVIIKVMGGLGNQIYQYALYEQYLRRGADVYLDLSWYEEKNERPMELDLFPNIEYRICTHEQKQNVLNKRRGILDIIRGKKYGLVNQPLEYSESIYNLDDVYLNGYWGESQYWMPVIDILRKRLAFPFPNDEKNQETLAMICSKNSVSLHIRRGDYLEDHLRDVFGGICTKDYYSSALQYVEKIMGEMHLFVFSDDSTYAKEHYRGKNVTVVDWNSNEKSIFDMMLMSNCKANICANSTFSKWAAALNENNNALRIIPLKHNNRQNVDVKKICKEMKDWIVIDEKGVVCR